MAVRCWWRESDIDPWNGRIPEMDPNKLSQLIFEKSAKATQPKKVILSAKVLEQSTPRGKNTDFD